MPIGEPRGGEAECIIGYHAEIPLLKGRIGDGGD
jgi:hypothetical protein